LDLATAAQLDALLVETRLAREATDKLLAETKRAARGAVLRWAIEHAEMHEFAFNYFEDDGAQWRSTESESGWVVKQILCSFLQGRKHVLNDLFDRPGDPGHVGDKWSNESENAFAYKLVEQIDKLIGEKPHLHKQKYGCLGDCDLHGPYDEDLTADSLLADFLVFARLAVERKAVPHDFDWPRLCAQAGELILYAFEKSDANEKYGSENVFAGMMGGRSLRWTAEVIYGKAATPEENDARHLELLEQVASVRGRFVAMAGEQPCGPESVAPVSRTLLAMLADVGGFEAWAALYRKLCDSLTDGRHHVWRWLR
jgi:hypothetical protein